MATVNSREFSDLTDAYGDTPARTEDPRLGSRIKFLPRQQWAQCATGDVLLVGHPHDRGIQIGGGRGGAALGPYSFRKSLSRVADTVPLLQVFDAGDAHSEHPDQDLGRISSLASVLTIGGGHDFAYFDVRSFLAREKPVPSSLRPLVVNIDAHLDVRLPEPNGPSSGSPFRRLLEDKDFDFELVQVGIQPAVNSLAHFNYCERNGVKVFRRAEVADFIPWISTRTKSSDRPCFLSVDLDAFHSGIAPGVSAPSPVGLEWLEFVKLFSALSDGFNIKALGIYELSPGLDRDQQTAKLAAHIAHTWLEDLKPNHGRPE
jgi:formiminoglutamase